MNNSVIAAFVFCYCYYYYCVDFNSNINTVQDICMYQILAWRTPTTTVSTVMIITHQINNSSQQTAKKQPLSPLSTKACQTPVTVGVLSLVDILFCYLVCCGSFVFLQVFWDMHCCDVSCIHTCTHPHTHTPARQCTHPLSSPLLSSKKALIDKREGVSLFEEASEADNIFFVAPPKARAHTNAPQTAGNSELIEAGAGLQGAPNHSIYNTSAGREMLELTSEAATQLPVDDVLNTLGANITHGEWMEWGVVLPPHHHHTACLP